MYMRKSGHLIDIGLSRERTAMELVPLLKPKINLRLCQSEGSIPPINAVRAMDEDSFEDFISEWLYTINAGEYTRIYRIGGSGDKGRDVIAERDEGPADIFQCKHYRSALSFGQALPEIGKLVTYTFHHDYPLPASYYFVAPWNLSSALQGIVDDPAQLREKVFSAWGKELKIKLNDGKYEPFTGELRKYAEQFDYSIIGFYPIEKVIDSHKDSLYGYLRFGAPTAFSVDQISASEEEDTRRPYIKQLLAAYSDKNNRAISDTEELSAIDSFSYHHMKTQRQNFCRALSAERMARDLFVDDEFAVVKDEIESGVESAYYCEDKHPYERMRDTLAESKKVDVSVSPLDYKLHWIGNREKEGACHLLVDESRLFWDWGKDGFVQ